MTSKRRSLRNAGVVAGVTLTLLALSGCSKEEPAATTTKAETEAKDLSMVGKEMAAAAKDQAVAAKEQVAAAMEQTTCPVMDGNPIDKNVFVEYKGKKVYFCCKACVEQFQADPEKYVAKLPQFRQ